MIEGNEIRAARERAGLSQQELAKRLDVSLRTVGNWERGETVPRNREAKIRDVLADWLDGGAPKVFVSHPTPAYLDESALRSVSDVELLAEIARRFSGRVVSDEEWERQRNREAQLEHEDGEPVQVETLNSPNPYPAGTLDHRRFEAERKRAREAFVDLRDRWMRSNPGEKPPVNAHWIPGGNSLIGLVFDVPEEEDELVRDINRLSADPSLWGESRKTTDAPPVPEDAAAHDPGEPSQGDQRRGAQDSSYDIDQDRGQS